MEKEVYKDILDYEGLYQVSNFGNIYSFPKNNPKNMDGKILTPTENKDGYFHVQLWKSKVRKTFKVHRLVAIAFISNPDNKNEVNHIDGNKSNNGADNLEWNTDSENITHAYKTGLNKKRVGAEVGNSKLTEAQVIEIRTQYTGRKGITQNTMAIKYGVTRGLIGHIINRRLWKQTQ